MKSALLMTLICVPFGFLHTQEPELPWQFRHAEGWAWYHDYKKTPEPKKVDEVPKDPIVILGLAKEEMERAMAIAMLEPTKENILVYMKLQKKWTDQASIFSQQWKINILEHPELSSLTPTTQYGVQVRKEVEAQSKKLLINTLAKHTTLLFFYEGENAYSKAFSNAVSEFSRQHNWDVKAITMDGFSLSTFPQTINDPTIAKDMEVSIFPSLFIIEEKSLKAVPIAFGMATINQIEENIFMQFGVRRHD